MERLSHLMITGGEPSRSVSMEAAVVRTSTLLLFAVIIFLVGALAGSLIVTPSFSPSAGPQLQSGSATFSDRGPTNGPVATNGPAALKSADAPNGDAAVTSPNLQLASFEQFADASNAGSPPSDLTVRAEIRKHFPDLAEQKVDGWVEAYRDISLAELQGLLRERKMLDDLIPASQFDFKPLPSFDVQPVVQNQYVEIINRIRRNVVNVTTPGYRRSIVRTAPTSFTDDLQVSADFTFSFAPGTIEPSPEPFYFAIDDDGTHWFRLTATDGKHPEILTRHGAFSLLPNHRLGLTKDDVVYCVTEKLEPAANPFEIEVSANGELRVTNDDEQVSVVGQLHIVNVTSTSQLKSLDGVFFKLPEEGVTTIDSSSTVQIQPRALESSNTDPRREHDLLNHFEQLAKSENDQ